MCNVSSLSHEREGRTAIGRTRRDRRAPRSRARRCDAGPVAFAGAGADGRRCGDARRRDDERPVGAGRSRASVSDSDSAGPAGRPPGRGYRARRPVRGRAPDRHRQGRRHVGAPGARQPGRHARQRPDPPLRREPVGHRRGRAPGNRASARQEHLGGDGGGQDRRRAPRTVATCSRRTISRGSTSPSPEAPRRQRRGEIRTQLGRSTTDRKKMAVSARRADAKPSPITTVTTVYGAPLEAGGRPRVMPAGNGEDASDPRAPGAQGRAMSGRSYLWLGTRPRRPYATRSCTIWR